MVTETMMQWQQSPKENRTQHRAFLDFCRMGPRRNVGLLFRRYHYQQLARERGQPVPAPPYKSIGTLEKLSITHAWHERAAAYDRSKQPDEETIPLFEGTPYSWP